MLYGLVKRAGILISVLLISALIFGIGDWIHAEYSGTTLTILNIAVSGGLTAGLVILYAHQATILKSQKDLLTQELHRDARQQHTETLRERVAEWHGDPELDGLDAPIGDDERNIPQISRASFESAPSTESVFVAGDEDEFRVIPEQLRGDRYLTDLLNNHAPELQETTDNIERLYDEFTTLRDEFRDAYDDAIVREYDDYTIKPTEWLSLWVFELVVMDERGTLGPYDTLQERGLAKFEQGSTGPQPDETRLWLRVKTGAGSSSAIYSAV